MSTTPFSGMLVLAVPPAAVAVIDCTPAEAARAAEAVSRQTKLNAAERVRLSRIGNRALLAAACNELLLRAGAPAERAAA